jgi:hypothetical protein
VTSEDPVADRPSDGENTSPGDRRRARARDAAERSASAGPSAARWIVPVAVGAGSGTTVVVDVVADVLRLDPRTRLRGRGDAALRALAGRIDELVTAGAVAPSGRPVVEVLVTDAAAREALAPSFDLDALLTGGPVDAARHDRTVRIAEAMLDRAAEHRAGDVDLHAEVAPVGVDRHDLADEVESLVHVATEAYAATAGPDPAVVVAPDGWIGVSPVELFIAAARGVLRGAARDVGGAALARWLAAAQRDGGDPWWLGLTGRIPVDAAGLLQQAAARAGADHPDVMGGVLVDLVAGRYPLDPLA